MSGFSLEPGPGRAPDTSSTIDNSTSRTVQDLNQMTDNMGLVTSAQINSSVSLGMQTANRQVAKQFSEGLQATSR